MVTQILKDESLISLGSLATVLSVMSPEGVVPDDEQLDSLRRALGEASEEVRSLTDLPEEVRRLLLERLSDMVLALDNLVIGGPDAVRRAAERLSVAPESAQDSPPDENGAHEEGASTSAATLTKLKTFARLVCTIFTAGTAIHSGIDAWSLTAHWVAGEIDQ